jgi:hypothetical protein
MNVNLWGPQLWEILHGIAGMTQHETSAKYAQGLLEGLLILLPCIHCRKSYIEFYTLSPKVYLAFQKNSSAMQWMYDMHNKVNDKLEIQRLEKYIGQNWTVQEKKAGENRPSFEVVQKRFLLANERPFCEDSVWRVLIAFALNSNDSNSKKEYLLWIQNLANFLRACSTSYDDLITKLDILSATSTNSTKDMFCAILLIKENKLLIASELIPLLADKKIKVFLSEKWNQTKLLFATGCSTNSSQ